MATLAHAAETTTQPAAVSSAAPSTSLAAPTVPSTTFAAATANARAAAVPHAGFVQPVPAPLRLTLPVFAQSAAPRPAAPVALVDLVASFVVQPGELDQESDCLAKAVYFEARGESLEGQLAVAKVVLNRTMSGLYPTSICGVVTQPAQFSFVRHGELPRADESSEPWRKAVAIADVARKNLAHSVGSNVMWYHADYVSPSWSRLHAQVARIGAHIFYG
ncbi:MAG: cell wall hydrolase [Novosphingobium sp.]|nr:cell wall hydrolase [Novosphingobium sp.]